MATRKCTKTVRLLHLVEDIPPEIQKLLPSNLKEIQNFEHPLLMKTLQQMRDTETTFFDLDTIFPCVLAFLLHDYLSRKYEKELQDELQATLDSVLEMEPDNLIALCIKQKMKKTKATKKKIESIVTQSNILNQAFSTVAFYFHQLNLTKASTKLFEQAIKGWEQNGNGNDVKVVIWKLLLAEAYCQLLYRDVFNEEICPDTTMIRVHELLQSGIEFKENQDKPLRYIAARCYIVLALAYNKYQQIQNQNDRQKDICMAVDVKRSYNEAWKLCDGQDPYVMQYYGLFLKKSATNAESLMQAIDILVSLLHINPHKHVAAHQLALIYETLWVAEKQRHDNFNYETRLGVEKQQERKSGRSHQESRHQSVGEGGIKYERLNKESSKTREGAVGGSRLSSNETIGCVVGDSFSSRQALQGTVGGENVSSVEALQRVVAGDNLHSETLKGAVGGSNLLSSETLECTVDRNNLLSSLEGAVLDSNLSSSEILEGAVGSSDLSVSETLEGAVGGRDLSSSETLEGAVGDTNLSSSETVEWAVGGSNLSSSETMKSILRGEGQPNKDVWHIIKWLEEMFPHQTTESDILKRSAEIFTKIQTSRKPLSCHLKLARKYLIMANESSNGQIIKYLVDLARMHAYCGETDSALRYFENAKCVFSSHPGITRAHYWDMAYLYEQWALMLVRQLERRKQCENLQSNLETMRKELEKKLNDVYIFQNFENTIKQMKLKLELHLRVLTHLSDKLKVTKYAECQANAFIELAKDELKRRKNIMRQQENQIKKEEKWLQQHGNRLKGYGTLLNDWTLRINANQKDYEDLLNLVKNEQRKLEVTHKEDEILQRKIQQLQSNAEVIKITLKDIQRHIKKHINGLEYLAKICNPSISKKDIRENLEDILKHLVEKELGEVDNLIEKVEDILAQLEDVDAVTASDVSDDDEFEGEAQQLNRIECYFLKSIRSAVKTKYSSKRAFNKLAEMMENDLKNDTSSQKWLILCEIYQLAGQYEKAKHLLEDKDMTTSKGRKLFKQQCGQGQEFGKYLDLAFSVYHNTPDDLLRHDIVEMTMRKMKQEAAAGVDDDDIEPFKAYGDAMKVFLMEPIRDKPFKVRESCGNNESADTSFLVFMARPENTETGGFKYIVENLQRCGIQVKRYLKRSIDDFEFGCNIRVEMLKMIEVCQLILVSDFKDNCPMGDSLPPVGFIIEAVEEYGRKVPVLILHETENPPKEQWKKLPHLDIREVDNDTKFHSFMTELFQNTCQPKCSICKNTLRRMTITA